VHKVKAIFGELGRLTKSLAELIELAGYTPSTGSEKSKAGNKNKLQTKAIRV
jgi:hypothetical protein